MSYACIQYSIPHCWSFQGVYAYCLFRIFELHNSIGNVSYEKWTLVHMYCLIHDIWYLIFFSFLKQVIDRGSLDSVIAAASTTYNEAANTKRFKPSSLDVNYGTLFDTTAHFTFSLCLLQLASLSEILIAFLIVVALIKLVMYSKKYAWSSPTNGQCSTIRRSTRSR